jgi:hypothetical protein
LFDYLSGDASLLNDGLVTGYSERESAFQSVDSIFIQDWGWDSMSRRRKWIRAAGKAAGPRVNHRLLTGDFRFQHKKIQTFIKGLTTLRDFSFTVLKETFGGFRS